ncbi:pseudaminic acid biosynthesis-associated methylase [Candidatus Pelagibacter sp. Uisw_127]|uniref:pseudaminic acid biosynthesis-associated methylase n=1 Tax=Candidatus Pelagibacter sp. Uisw_127 TaxID=3230988 RepID=UPI0039EC8CF5
MNEQEKFWIGDFGDNYTKRLPQKKLIKNNFHFFKKVLKKNIKINSILELGANNGSNLLALKKIFQDLKKCSAVEINKNACKKLNKIKFVEVHNKSISEFNSKDKYDFVFIKGVLIHINPKELDKIYSKISELSKKYVLIAEYFNPYPVRINYRGHKNKLFKRDFAGEFLKKTKKFKIIDYGFVYSKDKFPQDDLTWFLLKKN